MAQRPSYRREQPGKPGGTGRWPSGAQPPAAVAPQVRYVANGEHKDYPSATGLWTFHPRADKAKCDRYPEAVWPRLAQALREAILAACVSNEFRAGFPARVWAYVNGTLHEARLSNRGNGEYHGFPLNYPEQFPHDPDGLLKDAHHVDIPLN